MLLIQEDYLPICIDELPSFFEDMKRVAEIIVC